MAIDHAKQILRTYMHILHIRSTFTDTCSNLHVLYSYELSCMTVTTYITCIIERHSNSGCESGVDGILQPHLSWTTRLH